jgi:hypothetical protein
MGVGYDTNEAENEASNGVYPSVMDNLKSNGIIDRKAYSLYLNDLQANTGAIIFGGVDTTKYTGELVVLPLQVSIREIFPPVNLVLTCIAGWTIWIRC